MKFFLMIETIFSMLSVVITIFGVDNPGYSLLLLLPAGYSIFFIFFNFFRKLEKNNIALKSIHVIVFIKYVIMPFFIVINEDYYNGVLTGQIPASDSVKKAILLMFYELIIVVFGIYLYSKIKKEIKSNEFQAGVTHFNFAFIVIVIAGFLLMLKFHEYLLPQSIFVLDSDFTKKTTEFEFDGLVKIIFEIFKLIILLYFLQKNIINYQKSTKYKYIINTGICTLIYIAFQTSTSRWGILIPVLVIFYFCSIYFKKNFKIIAIVVGSVLVVSILSISVYKFAWLFNNQKNDSLGYVFKILTMQFQEYFSGPRAVAQGVEAIEQFENNISIKTFFNDYLGSVPLLSHSIDQKDRINIYYNYYLKGYKAQATQIMPMITIGLAYFSWVLSPLLTIINIIFALRIADKEYLCNNIFYKYIYVYASIWLSMSLMFNTQIIFGWLISTYIPFLIVLFLNNHFCIKRKNNEVQS